MRRALLLYLFTSLRDLLIQAAERNRWTNRTVSATVVWMRPSGRAEHGGESESIEFVPKRELDRAQQEVERLRKQSERLQKENERLKEEAERLRRELEAALRATKRQAAPHSRGNPKANPKRPGRKPGRSYGRQGCRPIPSRVDERIAVPLPAHCPHCGGSVASESCETQYQEEIVRRTIVR